MKKNLFILLITIFCISAVHAQNTDCKKIISDKQKTPVSKGDLYQLNRTIFSAFAGYAFGITYPETSRRENPIVFICNNNGESILGTDEQKTIKLESVKSIEIIHNPDESILYGFYGQICIIRVTLKDGLE